MGHNRYRTIIFTTARRLGAGNAFPMRLFALVYYRTLSTYFHEETGKQNLLQSPKSSHFNCFWTSLQQFSKYAQHASEPDQKKPSHLLSEIENLPRQFSSLP